MGVALATRKQSNIKKIILNNFRPNFQKVANLHKIALQKNSRIIIHISDERACHPLQESEVILFFFYFKKNLQLTTLLILYYFTTVYYFCVIVCGMIFCISGERDWCSLKEK